MYTILLIGMAENFIKYTQHREDIRFVVIEEEDLFYANNCECIRYNNLVGVYIGKYMHSTECISIARKLNREIKIDAVIPGRDYAVETATAIADDLGVNSLGMGAAKALTNKFVLRNTCSKGNINQPLYSKISSIQELKKFCMKNKRVIFKPSNRQASLGISLITDNSNILEAYEYTTSADEDKRRIAKREFKKEYIAEQYIDGEEYSTELLIFDKRILFSNITKKDTMEDSFVELQHLVPGDVYLSQIEVRALEEQMNNLVSVLDVKSGILHAEWKMNNGIPYLIECAGRIPGDYICRLISLAYDMNFYEETINIYLGLLSEYNENPIKYAMNRYFTAKAGKLVEINGKEKLDTERVIQYNINYSIGEEVPEVKSSWERMGNFIIVNNRIEELEKQKKNILDDVSFKTI